MRLGRVLDLAFMAVVVLMLTAGLVTLVVEPQISRILEVRSHPVGSPTYETGGGAPRP
jgi:hypothetical protein